MIVVGKADVIIIGCGVRVVVGGIIVVIIIIVIITIDKRCLGLNVMPNILSILIDYVIGMIKMSRCGLTLLQLI